MKVLRTRRRVRIVEGPDVVSHPRSPPGPTHGFFDLLAACPAMLAPEDIAAPRMLLLGFAAGGIVAPLRALGWSHPLDAVDLALAPAAFFHEIARDWAGAVRLVEAEA